VPAAGSDNLKESQLHTMQKNIAGLIISSALTLIGILLRLNAAALAWPETYSYSGSRAETSWARQEDAIGQVGLILMVIGGLLFVVTYLHWLFAKETNTIQSKVSGPGE
jgi:heme/copper-type cytochrome/quinol oxidase subunit 4